MTYEQFVINYKENLIYKGQLRDGQALMNYLYSIWAKEYDRICYQTPYTKPDIDCFYNDKFIDNTLEHLKEVWCNYPN